MKNLSAQRNSSGAPASVAVFLISCYRLIISPHLSRNACRFYPTCSEYAAEAMQHYGAIKGGLIGLKRILRCNPLCAGGYDPIKQ